jgi:outer membrane protein insertion porin family
MSLNKKLAASLFLSASLFAMSDAVAGTIRAIQITGNKRIETESILSHLPVRAGDTIDTEAQNQLLKDLYATGYFADVSLKESGGTLLIHVVENSSINRVVFEGNSKIKDDKLQEEVQLKPREVLSRTKIQAAQARILDLYKRMGRYGATVEPKIIKLNDNRIDVVFEINEGEVTYVQKINFIGNKHFSKSKLESQLMTKRYHWYRFFASDDTYDSDRFMADQYALRQFYNDNGYPDFRIISANAELTPDHKDFFLTFTIDEGDLYTFGKVKLISRVKAISAEQFESKLTMKSGDVFSAKQIERTITQIGDEMGNKGFAFAEVTPQINKNRTCKTIDVTYEIQEGPRVYVERIDVIGNDHTRDNVIRRELRLQEGDAYNTSKVKRSEQRLKNLGYFKKVEITTEPGTDKDKARVLVNIEEQQTGELSLAGGYSTLDKALANIKFSNRNFMGTGRTIHTDLTIAQKAQSFDIGLIEPYLMGYNLEGSFDIFHTRSNRFSTFTKQVQGASFGIGYELTEYLWQSWGYDIREDRVNHISNNASRYIQQQAGNFSTSAVKHSLSFDRRDSAIDPTSGYILSMSNAYAGLGGKVKNFQNSVGASWFYSPIEEVVLNVRGSATAITKVANRDIRIADSIMLGQDSFRGFDYGGLGPRDAQTKDPLGGTRAWTGTVELAFPIGLPNEFGVKGAVFADFGSLWKPGFSAANAPAGILDKNSIRASAGFGISWISPLGPLKVDYAFPLKKEKFDETRRLTFGFTSRF